MRGILKEILDKIEEKKSLENELSKSNLLINEKTQQQKSMDNTQKSLQLQIEESKKTSFERKGIIYSKRQNQERTGTG